MVDEHQNTFLVSIEFDNGECCDHVERKVISLINYVSRMIEFTIANLFFLVLRIITLCRGCLLGAVGNRLNLGAPLMV